ncbi:MAG TPA: alkaline phosphatase PafA [Daejeonella sp.]|nr:alkaline phosphatase PafA [Daejeonella sp.]
MKFKYLLLLFVATLAYPASAQKAKPTAQANTTLARPKLVIGIMVDQMRWDFLYRYYDRYQSGGFKRMLNEGFTCENTQIDYATTVTAIGHSSVYTGSVPALHGISGNDFIIQATGKTMYCTEDSTVQTVGSNTKAGQMSPRNLLTTTITDELKLATNFRSKVIGIALKDRGGILPAGHAANAAYWYDDSGSWITSTYYMKDLPAWVKKFNQENPAQKYLKQDWNTLYPINTYVQSSPDNNRYEGKFPGTEAPTLPVKTSQMADRGAGLIRSTPYGNTMTKDLAMAAIENEQLGQGSVTDFLAVSFSSPDYIGHQFGPNSIEVEDTYLRLDRDLAELFNYLDAKVGKGNYTAFLSADHGAAHNPNFLLDNNIPAGFWPTRQITQDLNSLLEKEFKFKNLVLSLSNYQVSLNNALIAKEKLSEKDIRRACVNYLQGLDGVAYAIDIDKIQEAPIPETLKDRIVKAYNPARSGVVQIILKPGWFSSSGTTGTTHGSWNPYDAHIPMVFMGWGIKQGKTNAPTNMTDISATLAALLRIQMPNGCIGKPVTEMLK